MFRDESTRILKLVDSTHVYWTVEYIDSAKVLVGRKRQVSLGDFGPTSGVSIVERHVLEPSKLYYEE